MPVVADGTMVVIGVAAGILPPRPFAASSLPTRSWMTQVVPSSPRRIGNSRKARAAYTSSGRCVSSSDAIEEHVLAQRRLQQNS